MFELQIACYSLAWHFFTPWQLQSFCGTGEYLQTEQPAFWSHSNGKQPVRAAHYCLAHGMAASEPTQPTTSATKLIVFKCLWMEARPGAHYGRGQSRAERVYVEFWFRFLHHCQSIQHIALTRSWAPNLTATASHRRSRSDKELEARRWRHINPQFEIYPQRPTPKSQFRIRKCHPRHILSVFIKEPELHSHTSDTFSRPSKWINNSWNFYSFLYNVIHRLVNWYACSTLLLIMLIID